MGKFRLSILATTLCALMFCAYGIGNMSLVCLADDDNAKQDQFEKAYQTDIKLLLEKYCHECHAGEVTEGELDLTDFATVAKVRENPIVWLRIREMLDDDQMPPEDSPQPTDEERKRLQNWVREFLTSVARARAGDPGSVVLRRFSNAEYNYTIRDLTGVVSLDPTDEFPVDGAAGEGFTNSGAAQGMSPSMVTKYLDAAKDVASHIVLLPDGIRFSSHSTRRDQTDELLAQIQSFYAKFTEEGDRVAVKLPGVKIDLNRGGLLPVEKYLAATIEERDALLDGSTDIESIAGQRDLNVRYLDLLWQTLSGDANAPSSSLIARLREQWQRATAEDTLELVTEITLAQQGLWKFNSIGQFGREGGPTSWMEPVSQITTQQEFQLKLPEPPDSDEVVFYLAVGDADDGDAGDIVTWKNARLEGGGRPPLLLRDVTGYARRLKEIRSEMLSQTAKYLSAVVDIEPDADVEQVAAKHGVDAGFLKVWLEYLGIDGGGPVELQGHFTEPLLKVGGYEFVNGWGSAETPFVIANSSDQEVRIPGLANPHAMMAHPSPTQFAAVGWQSPITGSVRAEVNLADAHPECGNGVEWFVQHRSATRVQELGKGEFGTGGEVTMPPQTILIRKGEVISFTLGPRSGNHGCDLTEFNVVVTETSGDKRVWNLSKDASGKIRESNPLVDSHGHKNIWHFYTGEMATVGTGPNRQTAPVGSLLAQWLVEQDQEKRNSLAQSIQALVTNEIPSDADSPDATLWQDLHTLLLPQDHDVFKDIRPDERFGSHPLGHETNIADLTVKAPAVVEFRIPAELAKGRELRVMAQLDANYGSEGSVQAQVQLQKPDDLSLALAKPILIGAADVVHDRVETALSDFRDLFPPALCYAKIVPVDEVVTLILFFREDEPLRRLMLSDDQAAELDRLWDELLYVSQEPLIKVVTLEQLMEFASQDRPDLVKAFATLEKPVLERAKKFRQRLVKSESAHLDAVLEFASRAWRRPLNDDDQHQLRGLYKQLRGNEILHEEAIRLTLARVLASPAFLYKYEQPAAEKSAEPVTDLELATRLSYFLWSSLPDEELRVVAEAGQLRNEEMLSSQARRMLQDPRTRRLAIQFACQWLHLRDFDENDDKNEKLYPEFVSLRKDMYEETVQFFEDMFRNDGSILGLLDADHTFLNETLGKHYAIEGVSGNGWRRIEGIRAKGRGGILGMATFLASQSGASRTSPILRGNWIYESLLGERLPRPPANVPLLPEIVPTGKTARQLIEEHSTEPSCAKCHRLIDPYGFALEQYDAIGRLRPQVVDTKTTLTDGKSIEGLAGLRNYLLEDRRDDVLRQFCRKLLGYSLGREVQLSDEPLLDKMGKELAEHDYRFSVAVEEIVLSDQFRKIRGRQSE